MMCENHTTVHGLLIHTLVTISDNYCSDKLLTFHSFFLSGASPIRRDPGRHFTAAQWARYCGRVVCADSIDKFVRTAVPGGDAALAAAGSSDLKHGGHGGLHGGGPGGGAGGKGGKSGGPFRSKSTGSRHKAGWLSREGTRFLSPITNNTQHFMFICKKLRESR